MFFLGNTFIYNNQSSDRYGLYFANVNSSISTKLGGDVKYTNLSIRRSGKQYRQDTGYETPLSFDVEMMTETLITQDMLHEINAWLFNQLDYKKLYVNDEYYTYNNIYFNCYFTDVERIEGCVGDQGYGIYGFKCTMVCDAPNAWEDEQTITYTAPFGSYLVFNNTSDCNDYMYPKVQFKTGSTGGNVTIQQVTDNNRLTTFTGLSSNETIIMSVEPKQVTSSLLLNRYEKFNKNWLRFLVGENRFAISGDVTELKITYTNARAV